MRKTLLGFCLGLTRVQKSLFVGNSTCFTSKGSGNPFTVSIFVPCKFGAFTNGFFVGTAVAIGPEGLRLLSGVGDDARFDGGDAGGGE